MGTDFALACGDCLEFIALHKWSILEYYSLPSQRVPNLSNQLIVPVTSKQLIYRRFKRFRSTPAIYRKVVTRGT